MADSALVTKANLAAVAGEGYRFVSRLPWAFKEAASVWDAAFAAGKWTEVGALSPKKNAATYKVWETKRVIDKRSYRMIVVSSSSLDRRKSKKLEADIVRKRRDLEHLLREEASKRYACQADAKAAFGRLAPPKYWTVSHEIEEVAERHYPHRGRPKKGEEPRLEPYFRLIIRIGPKKGDAIAQIRRHLSAFVLISNDPDRTATELLREDKEQTSVEQGMRFVKEPRHIAPVFLKRPDRIEAFAHVTQMALLVYTLIQKIRGALPSRRSPFPRLLAWGATSPDRPGGARPHGGHPDGHRQDRRPAHP